MPVDPRIVELLAEAERTDPRPLETLSVAEARARGGSVNIAPALPLEPVADVRDLIIDTLPPIAARLYRPRGGTRPLLVYFHGGGWVVGSVAISDPFCRAIANSSGCAVLSVEYRLAPEDRYPAAADDAYAATRWSADHATDLGIDPTRVAVGGSSAGGNLAAVVTLMARERRAPKIAFQLLHVPVTDHDFETLSYRANATGYGLTRNGMRWFWDHYAPDPKLRSEPYASPLRARDLSGLPRAHVVTAECDPLRDEGKAYAARLIEAGVPTTYVEYPGMVHGFTGMAVTIPMGRTAIDDMGAALRIALA
ncbi:MAG TPA: alpha/beta hydrolase [Candidatus Limnocylindria bacterium]|jgi:acetyl esterase|nr:alpha/beta hydrolase [Candidatus Limnocylindria bacterium]